MYDHRASIHITSRSRSLQGQPAGRSWNMHPISLFQICLHAPAASQQQYQQLPARSRSVGAATVFHERDRASSRAPHEHEHPWLGWPASRLRVDMHVPDRAEVPARTHARNSARIFCTQRDTLVVHRQQLDHPQLAISCQLPTSRLGSLALVKLQTCNASQHVMPSQLYITCVMCVWTSI